MKDVTTVAHLSDGSSLRASKVHHEQYSRPHLLRHIHHPTTLLHCHLRRVCVCVWGCGVCGDVVCVGMWCVCVCV